ncbi:Serine/threonine-protein kinase ATM [Platanthera guangdongensis]|uniref:Serine/threonine-protein kinase ATM n=1 Tax=Platanthera guangdongensis TaxID=2320717 RepID=A0ABR2LSR7_9ASPA
MECINTYLLKDGPYLGDLATYIHLSIPEFLFRFCLTTHDRGLKVCFIIYASIQTKLYRNTSDEILLVEKLLDIVSKDLGQETVASSGMLWCDASRDDKMGLVGNVYQSLMELAALVFFPSCKPTRKATQQEKRLKMVDACDPIKDGVMSGSWLWSVQFMILQVNYLARMFVCIFLIFSYAHTKSFSAHKIYRLNLKNVMCSR